MKFIKQLIAASRSGERPYLYLQYGRAAGDYKLSGKGMKGRKINSIGNYVKKVVTDKTAQVKKIFFQ